jgi:AcrR family transcriptional regulator
MDQTSILKAAEDVILQYGFEKTRMSDIAKKFGVSHAALYKYFKNKDDLMKTLAQNWLEENERPLKKIVTEPASNNRVQLKNWLLNLVHSKKDSFQKNPKMFELYTIYIEHSPSLLEQHLLRLTQQISLILTGDAHEALEESRAILEAFTIFHNPYFKDRWDRDNYDGQFEQIWALINNGIQQDH